MRWQLLAIFLFCAAALGSCSLRSRFCGRSGEPCCTEGVACEGNLSCGEQNVCRAACGGAGAACCAQDRCDEGLACGAGVCAQPACDAGCVRDERRCTNAGGVDVCLAGAGGCPAWVSLVPVCPQPQSCGRTDAGVGCTDGCPGACILDSTLCTTEGLKVCRLDPQSPSGCPELVLAQPSPDNPSCLTGACDGPLCWQSPLPQGNPVRAVTGWAIDQLYVLDESGSILRHNGTSWEYDWRPTTAGALRAVSSCLFATLAFAVGDNGQVLRRNSAGWVPELLPDANVPLRAVACDPSLRAFAAAADGRLYARDQLATGTWRRLSSPVAGELRAVTYYPFAGLGLAVGAFGTLVACKSVNVPASTSCAVEGAGLTLSHLNAVWVDVMTGEAHAAGTEGTLLRRGGGTWTPVSGLGMPELLAVAGVQNDGPLFVAGAGGTFLYRSGANWLADSFTSQTISTLAVVEPKGLYAVAGAELWLNEGGGSGPWRRTAGGGPLAVDVNALVGSSAKDVYAVGEGGAVLHKNGDAWTREAQGLTPLTLNGAVAVSPQELYAVGEQGVVISRRYGKWAVERSGGPALYAAWTDGSVVYAVGAEGAWLEKPVGAAASDWTVVSQTAVVAPLFAVTGRPGVEVLAVGANCAGVRKAGGAFAPFPVPGCGANSLNAAWEGPDGELFLGGGDGLLLHRVGGVWNTEPLGMGTSEAVLAVGAGGGEAYALCTSGQLYHRSAGSWRQEGKRLTSLSLQALYSAPEGDVFIGGGGGLIWRRK